MIDSFYTRSFDLHRRIRREKIEALIIGLVTGFVIGWVVRFV
jgi:hypothetical protein